MTKAERERLRTLAERATPGPYLGDRYDGTVKYAVKNPQGQTVLTVDHKDDTYGFLGENPQADEAYFLASDPTTVAALIVRVERLELALSALVAGEGYGTEGNKVWDYARAALREERG